MTSRTPSHLTAEGTNLGNFSRGDWALLVVTALIWGSSFLWIAMGLDAFHPGAIALIRVLLGAGVLALSRSTWKTFDRADLPSVAVVAIAGNAAPALLFPFAQQRVESSVAGMLNSAAPVAVLLISLAMTRKAPLPIQLAGLAVGLAGAICMALPNVRGADAEPVGVLLVLLAMFGYATANNFIPPLQQKYGGPAVILRALAISAVLLLPYGIYGLAKSDGITGTVDGGIWAPVIALLILGIFGTGIARSSFANLVGRVGAPRASMIGYLVPVVAIILGVVVRDETVGALELTGTALVVLGARLISRGRS